MLSIASIAILSSCSKEDDNADVTDVKIDFTVTPGNPEINTVVTLNISLTGNPDNKLKSMSVTRNDGKTIASKSLSGTTAVEVLTDSIGDAQSYTYTVAVTGEKGSPVTKPVTIVTKLPAGPVDVSPTAVPLFSQLFSSGGAHFIEATDPYSSFTTELHAANIAKIDLVYYYGGSKHTITSPDDAPMQDQIYKTNYDWTGAKKTVISKSASTTAAEFDAYVQGGSDEALTQEGLAVTTWSSAVKDLKEGEVYIYKTAAGKYGYFKVNAVVGTNSTDSQIDLKFVTQQ